MIIGIDPGATGAIAFLLPEGGLSAGMIYDIEDMPIAVVRGRKKLVPQLLREILTKHKVTRIYLEEVSAMPRDGVVGAFAFGASYGCIQGVIVGLGLPYTLVRPQAWKKAAGLLGADKGASRALAARLWPLEASRFARIKDDGRAESALIAKYGDKA